MNYRHIYHAGNFADVFKHIVLMLVIEHLKQKDKPFFVLDTHAGIGLYDLQSVEAQKTQEAAAGIHRIWDRQDKPEAVKRYCGLVKRLNPAKGLPRFYPGSPVLAREMLREKDRLVVNELHPEDVKTLRRNMGKDERLKVEHDDGYIVLKAQLPPPERRGAVLIDPPFELRHEWDLMIRALHDAHKRWATGTFVFWYPIKDPALIREFHAAIAESGLPDIIALDFLCRPPVDTTLFNGTGLIIVNPPWQLTQQLEPVMPWLVKVLTDGAGSYQAVRISEEKA